MSKIIIITRSMSSGGAERVIAQLVNYFVSEGIQCEVITTEKLKVEYELKTSIKLLGIGKKSKNKIIDRIKRYKVIRKEVNNEKPDCVLTMPEDTGIYVILSLIGSHIPVYVSERNNPWVMPDSKITRLLRHIAYPFAKGIIFQTEMAKSFFSRSIQEKSIVLDNPVDERRIPEHYIGDRNKIIDAVGRLVPQKNFDLLIDSFADFYRSHKDYRLHIYGEGPLKEHLQRKINSYGLKDVAILEGHSSNVLSQIKKDSIFVLSSDYEGMPNALIEAMCMGLPCISTDCPSGGPRKLIKNGVNGILVDVGNEKMLTQALKKLTDEKISKQLQNEAYKLRDKLTDPKIFEKWKKYLLK